MTVKTERTRTDPQIRFLPIRNPSPLAPPQNLPPCWEHSAR